MLNFYLPPRNTESNKGERANLKIMLHITSSDFMEYFYIHGADGKNSTDLPLRCAKAVQMLLKYIKEMYKQVVELFHQ